MKVCTRSFYYLTTIIQMLFFECLKKEVLKHSLNIKYYGHCITIKIRFRILVCSYVDIGPEQALDVSIRSPSEDPGAPIENILQTKSNCF